VGSARTFADQAAVFGDKMVHTWSGAIIYEWIQETNNYGLVDYPLSGAPSPSIGAGDAAFGRNGTPQRRSPDFENLSNQWAALTPTGIRADDYKPSLSAPACPDFTASAWQIKADAQLPTLGYGSKAVSSTSSSSDVSTSIASATGKANPGDSGSVQESTRTAEASSSATTSSAAIRTFHALPGSGILSGPWVAFYVALCAVAGVLSVL
jgi:hypothetical protein